MDARKGKGLWKGLKEEWETKGRKMGKRTRKEAAGRGDSMVFVCEGYWRGERRGQRIGKGRGQEDGKVR